MDIGGGSGATSSQAGAFESTGNSIQQPRNHPLVQQHLKLAAVDVRSFQPTSSANMAMTSAEEVDNDFKMLASFLAEDVQPYDVGVPPVQNMLNPMSGFQGMAGGGLLGLNFAARLNCTMPWPQMTPQPSQPQPQPQFPSQAQSQEPQSRQQQQRLPQQRLTRQPQAAMMHSVENPRQSPPPTPLPQQTQALLGTPSPAFLPPGLAMGRTPQQQAFVSPPQRYFAPMNMGLGAMGIPMPGLGPPSGALIASPAAADGLPVIPAMAGPPPGMLGMPGVSGVSGVPSLASRLGGATMMDYVQEAKKRRCQEENDLERKFQEQIVRRRERNRILARQTRMRKKFFYQSLQKRMSGLRVENRMLKSILTDKLGDRAEQVVHDCSTELSREVMSGRAITGEDGEDLLGDAELDAELMGGLGGEEGAEESGQGGGRGGKKRNREDATRTLSKPDFNLMKSLQVAQQNFVVTEPSLPDNPIVFASAGFLKYTGYTSEQAIDKGEDASVNFLNYKADGTPFWNQFFVAALRDEKNRIVNYVGAQCPVPGPLPPSVRKTIESEVSAPLEARGDENVENSSNQRKLEGTDGPDSNRAGSSGASDTGNRANGAGGAEGAARTTTVKGEMPARQADDSRPERIVDIGSGSRRTRGRIGSPRSASVLPNGSSSKRKASGGGRASEDLKGATSPRPTASPTMSSAPAVSAKRLLASGAGPAVGRVADAPTSAPREAVVQ